MNQRGKETPRSGRGGEVGCCLQRMRGEVEAAQLHSTPQAPVPVRVSRGCLRALSTRGKYSWKMGILLQLPQSGGAAAGAGGCCHPSLASLRARTPPRNGTRPGMHALSCFLLFLSPSASQCHPKDAGTWHTLGPGCYLA